MQAAIALAFVDEASLLLTRSAVVVAWVIPWFGLHQALALVKVTIAP